MTDIEIWTSADVTSFEAGPRPGYPSTATVPELVLRQAERTPDVTALRFGTDRLTYAGLAERSARLAGFLVECGVGLGTVVAVVGRPGIRMIVAYLAILRAGGVYLPLDPANPRRRTAFMLTDSQPELTLTTADCADLVGEGIVLEDLDDALAGTEPGRLPTHADPAAAACPTPRSTPPRWRSGARCTTAPPWSACRATCCCQRPTCVADSPTCRVNTPRYR